MNIRYRIIERVGSSADEYHWLEVDCGYFVAMPGRYCEPTMDDAREYAARFNREDREIQFYEEEVV